MIARDAEARRQNADVTELREGPILPAGAAGPEDPWRNLVDGDVVAAQLAREISDIADLDDRARRKLTLDLQIELLRVPCAAIGFEESHGLVGSLAQGDGTEAVVEHAGLQGPQREAA